MWEVAFFGLRPGLAKSSRVYLKAKRATGVTQVIEHLPKALVHNFSTTKKKKKKKKDLEDILLMTTQLVSEHMRNTPHWSHGEVQVESQRDATTAHKSTSNSSRTKC
jgi:hypothetical protein